MSISRYNSGSTFEADIGYARAVSDGTYVHVSGTTGFDYESMTIAEDVIEQTKQCLKNIDATLGHFGLSRADIVRVQYFLPNQADFEPCWPSLKSYFGDHPPAATMLVAGLSDPRMKIEIQLTVKHSA